jgi:uncharacterized membrane protein
MTDRQLVISLFEDEPAADAAASSLKDSGLVDGESLGILVLDDKGKLKVDKIGKRDTVKGAGVGAVLALLTPVGLGVAVAGGAAAGALHHKGLGLSDDDKARITGELTAGKAAVGVLARWEDEPNVSSKLTELGGTSEAHVVTDEGLEAAASAAPSA